jgi:two-component system, response regulator PdtaR
MNRSSEKKLLLVDDDRLVMATFGKGLKKLGYQVQMADSAQEGLQIIDPEDPPQIAILDICMPDMTGLQMAKELKALKIPWLFLSAYNDDEYVKQAVEGGALGYLIKPMDVANAIPAIETALYQARELMECELVEHRLNSALETGNIVNVAIGLLMERNRVSRVDAYELLRGKARSEQRKVKAVAEELLIAWENVNLLSQSR